jgi:hypothetical protein
MKSLTLLFSAHLLALEARLYKTWVTFAEYMTDEYQQRLRDGIVGERDAAEIAAFVKAAALDAGSLELAGIAEAVLRKAQQIGEEESRAASVAERDAAEGAADLAQDNANVRDAVFHGVQHYRFWEPYADRERRRQEKDRLREERWARKAHVTTSDIQGRLKQRFVTTAQVFGLLKELGFVTGASGVYGLTEKGRALGHTRGSEHRPIIYWDKRVFDLVQDEISRRWERDGWRMHLPPARAVQDPA